MTKKTKYTLEYDIRSSIHLLFEYLSTSSGLGKWFADDVIFKNDRFTFYWGGEEENAILIKKREGESLRLQWEDDQNTNYFFEWKIVVDDLTGDISLLVTDFADNTEIEESTIYWDSLVAELKHALGAG